MILSMKGIISTEISLMIYMSVRVISMQKLIPDCTAGIKSGFMIFVYTCILIHNLISHLLITCISNKVPASKRI